MLVFVLSFYFDINQFNAGNVKVFKSPLCMGGINDGWRVLGFGMKRVFAVKAVKMRMRQFYKGGV